MTAELKVGSMILLVVTILLFGSGASLARLITRDALFDGLRDRWRVHFLWRQARAVEASRQMFPPLYDTAIATYVAHQAKAGLARNRDELTAEERRIAVLHEIGDRSEEEPPAPWWVSGPARTKTRPWSKVSAQLVRLRGYSDFIGCPWCFPVYAFAAVGLWTWWRVYGFDTVLTWQDLNSAALPADWLVLSVLLTFRWVYALIATKLDQ
jgi:hypothetical protein